jgi:hypothetical protein
MPRLVGTKSSAETGRMREEIPARKCNSSIMELLLIALNAVQTLPVDVFWIAPEQYLLEVKTPNT